MVRRISEGLVLRTNDRVSMGAVCTVCGYRDAVLKVSRPGKGWGLREGNRLRGRMIQHVQDMHPGELLSVVSRGRAP